MKSVEEQLLDHDGTRYQAALGDVVRQLKPLVVVESGVQGGNSTLHILKAMDDVGCGHLHSIDPNPGLVLEHPRWTLWKEKSVTAFAKIYRVSNPWDIFLHDSDHDVGCQTFEYEAAWKFLRAGGLMVSDDVWWDQPTHYAWDKFAAEQWLKDGRIGCAGSLYKPNKKSFQHCPVNGAERVVTKAIKSAYFASLKHGHSRSIAEYDPENFK